MPGSTTLPPLALPRLPALIIACLAATWLIWGSTYLAIKWALVSFPPFFQMGTRFLAAGLILGAWARWRGNAWPSRAQWVNAAILGALMLGGGYGGTAVAQTSISSGLVVAFVAVVPALVALGQWPYGVRPSRIETAGIVLGLVGIVLLTRGQGFSGSVHGLLAMFVASSTWTLGTVWALHGLPNGRRLALSPGGMGYASQMLAGGAVLLVLSGLVGEQPSWPPDARALASWLYLVVAGSLLAFSAYMVLLQRTSATLASSYTFVNPVIGLVLGVTLGGEVVSRLEWGAAGIALLGVVLLAGRTALNTGNRCGPPRAGHLSAHFFCAAAERMALSVVRVVLTSASSLTCSSVGDSA
jgi:drug/metabolite transporter (DMT)-like permease